MLSINLILICRDMKIKMCSENIHFLYLLFPNTGCRSQLDPIPEVKGREAGLTLDRPPAMSSKNKVLRRTETSGSSSTPQHATCSSWRRRRDLCSSLDLFALHVAAVAPPDAVAARVVFKAEVILNKAGVLLYKPDEFVWKRRRGIRYFVGKTDFRVN